MSVILGIDPGLQHTGWAIIRSGGSGSRDSKTQMQASTRVSIQAVAYGVISTNAKDMLSQRLAVIFDDLTAVIERYQPTSCALEGVFFGLNAKTALSLGQARGAAILATAHKGLDMGEYPPATIKQAIVGTGNAEKEQVTYMVRQLLDLDHDPRPDHCADALAVAITHMAHMRHLSYADRSS